MLKAFQTAGIVKPFMVNDRGDIIAHSDGSIVLSGGNLAKLPIVDRMMKSTIDNGQSRYSDENGVFFLASFKKIDQYGCGVVSSVDERTAYQEVYNIQRRNIYLMIIMLSTAILIVFFFGRSITTPIIRLVAATKQIIQGNYRVNIRPTTRDEIGELTFSFIEMGKGLEEREKIKSAFGKFVNKEIAEAAMRDELRLGGERKNVAIFFSDIRSFTSISENLEPEQVVEFLNDYMTRMVKCVEENHGVVDKFIGDAIMAIWGTPLSSGNDTENAINSALQMRKELVLFNRDRGGPGKPFIKIGCGINSGPVLAGQIGSEDRMEYTVIGDAVNLASRIEALNKPFGTDILISEDAFAQVRDIFAVEKMQTIKVKGKEAPQQIFAVLGRLDDPSRIKTMDELRDMLGMEPQPFSRRSSDRDTTEEGEQKYEIIRE
jgi:adenylate cyclase